MSKDEKLILVGVISTAHGIKGDLLIKSYTEIASNLAKLPLIDENKDPVKLKLIRTNKNGIICRLSDCNDRNKAETLKGIKLYCLRKDFPTQIEEEFYIEDLRGLKIMDESDEFVGTVIEVANYGAGDIIEVKFNDDNCEMFPFTKELFPKITKDYMVLQRESD